MRETVLFTIDTPYRPALPVRAWFFGAEGQKSLAVMGALRGNEIQQMYICGRLIRALEAAESAGQLDPACGILVVPCANQFSMNVGRRFWAAAARSATAPSTGAATWRGSWRTPSSPPA